MAAKRGLGRGLDALFPVSESGAGVTQVPLSAINRNPRQPRMRLDSTELEDLASSIREHGVIQPLVVTQSAYPGQYTLIAGERRLEAARLAGLPTVPAIVREVSDEQMLELALVENLQRTDLGPFETATAYKHLAEDFSLSHDEIAAKVGKKRVTVTNTLRLLKLPQRILEGLANGQITEGHARALLSLPNAQAQTAAFATIVKKELSVRQHKPSRPTRPARQAEADALAARLRESLGTKVTLRRGPRGGTIIIHFYSDEELNAIASAIVGE
jgi:ParB family chromosome partitioning protein